MSDNPLYSSFMMLPERLYSVFVQYIVNGRTRAPPETELMEMLPTFQFGAKTDRRALQSKFKSWAKRMNFENGYLVLLNSGKIIIPKEKCDDLIMQLHSEEHSNVEKIIAQIRMTYSWTRKNFGMDRDVVVESISRNCERDDCLKKMRLEIARLSSSFCSNLPNCYSPKPFSEPAFRMPTPMQCIPPYPYRWPLAFPVGPMWSPNAFPFQIPFFNGMCNMVNTLSGCRQAPNTPILDQKELSDRVADQKTDMKANNGNFFSHVEIPPHVSNPDRNMSSVVFKKPKNIYEYKRLLESARIRSNEFPGILKSEKTLFLANLGIAPKSICSSRTLKKFRQELRKKNVINRECMIYREYKILRDRNKLKKCSHERKRLSYLEMPSSKQSTSTRLGKSLNETKDKESNFLEIPRKIKSEASEENSRNKRIKITHTLRKEPVEIIDIASSEDDTLEESPSNKEIMKDKGNTQIKTTQNQSDEMPNKHLIETIKENQASSEIHEEKVQNDIHSQEKTYPFSDEVPKKHLIETTKENQSTSEIPEEKVLNDIHSQGKTHPLADEVPNKHLIETTKKNQASSEIHEEKEQNDIHSQGNIYPLTETVQTKFYPFQKRVLKEIHTSNVKGKRVLLPKSVKYSISENKPPNSSNIPFEMRRFRPQLVRSYVGQRNITTKNQTNYIFPHVTSVPVAIRQKATLVQPRASSSVPNQNNPPRIVYPIQVPKSSVNSKLFFLDKERKGAFYIVPQYNRPILPHNFSRTERQVMPDSGQPKVPNFISSVSSQLHQLKSTSTEKDKEEKPSNTPGKSIRNGGDTEKIDMNAEMMRISRWIYRMKSNLNPCMIKFGIEKSVQKLISQLDIGIFLVRKAKKSLTEIENSFDIKKTSLDAAK